MQTIIILLVLVDVVWTYLSIPGQIDLECFAVVLETKGCHCEQDVFAINRLPFLLLTFLGRFYQCQHIARNILSFV